MVLQKLIEIKLNGSEERKCVPKQAYNKFNTLILPRVSCHIYSLPEPFFFPMKLSSPHVKNPCSQKSQKMAPCITINKAQSKYPKMCKAKNKYSSPKM